MSRVLLGVVVVLLLAPAMMAQNCSGSRPGAGPDVPCHLTVTTPYAGSVNQAQICWDTNNSSDSLAELDFNVNGYSAVQIDRYVYSASMVTHHCVVADHLLPVKTYLYNVVSCSTGPSGGGTPPFNCKRTDPNTSVATMGDPSGNYHGTTFTTAATNPANPTSWRAIPVSPSVSVYQGHSINIGITGMLFDGPPPTYAVITSVTVDSGSGPQACTVNKGGGMCGTTGISFQPDCGGGENVGSPLTNGYSTTIFSSGTWSGHYFCQSNTIFMGQKTMMNRLTASGGATPGTYTLALTYQGTDANQVNMGVSTSYTYSFTVNAAASFTIVPPTTFPPIPNLGAWNAKIATVGTAKYNLLKTANLTTPGVYINDNMSATETAFPPSDVFNYSGDRVTMQVMDYLAAVTAARQPGHIYAVGDMICTNGTNGCAVDPNYVEVVTTGGTSSSSSSLTFTATEGAITQDGTVLWTNAGNTAYWRDNTQRIGQQILNWELLMGFYSITSEWNMFPYGTLMDCQREYGTNCPTSIDAAALAHLAWPVVNVAGASGSFLNQIINGYKVTPQGTVRTLPYNQEILLANWLASGIKPVNGSVDEINARTDLMLQTNDEWRHASPLDGVTSEYALYMEAPNFDIGLNVEAEIGVFTAQVAMGVTPDARIPIDVMAMLDWAWSNQYNLLGNDFSFPYGTLSTPYQTYMYNYHQSNLNNLMAPGYAWLFAMYGNSCTLPTSGVSCQVAADTLFQHTFDVQTGTGKEFNQEFKWFRDFVGWRTGAITGTQSYATTPSLNPFVGTYPDHMEPYNDGEFPAKPTASSITGSGFTATWYTHKPVVTGKVGVGLTKGTIGTFTTCPLGSTLYNAATSLYKNVCAVLGLTANTTYYFGVGGTDAAGNVAFSSADVIGTGQDPRYGLLTGPPGNNLFRVFPLDLIGIMDTLGGANIGPPKHVTIH